ncbi:MAG: response regulator transcription factor, partial [Cyanobacteria bacterium P01_A01_bin.37]
LLAPLSLTETTIRELLQVIAEWPFETTLAMLLLVDFWPGSLLSSAAETPEQQLQRHLNALFATGGVSILPLSVSTAQLQGAIAAILQGFVVIHPDIANLLSAQTDPLLAEPKADRDAPFAPLTPREIEVLNQLAIGLSNKAIASELTISEHTVKFHISAILSKLNVSSRTEAVTIGIRAGLVMI